MLDWPSKKESKIRILVEPLEPRLHVSLKWKKHACGNGSVSIVICYNVSHCSQKAAPTLVLECYGSMAWISTNITNIYLVSIRFGTLQYLCNTLYKSQYILTLLGLLPYLFLFFETNGFYSIVRNKIHMNLRHKALVRVTEYQLIKLTRLRLGNFQAYLTFELGVYRGS
jgi:hypothetical protein